MSAYYINKPKKKRKKTIRITGILFILTGLSFFLYFFFPALSYQLFISNAFTGKGGDIEVPIPKRFVVSHNNDLRSLIAQGIAGITTDFTDARNWYPQFSQETQKTVDVPTYKISIPKIKVENAEVSTKDYDLEKHLIQYLGTSLPGEKGTAVIFGHSTLPQLFDPKNYKTIFAYAHKAEIGDEIFVTVKGIEYKYKVFSIVITEPEDTNILSQSYDHSYITLVTCTPPGTIWKRLVIRASLDSITN